jgi:hypothetical protein
MRVGGGTPAGANAPVYPLRAVTDNLIELYLRHDLSLPIIREDLFKQ